MCRAPTSRQTLKHPPKNLGYFIMPARGISDIAALICYYSPSGSLVGVARRYASIGNCLASITSRLPRWVSGLTPGHSILDNLCLAPLIRTTNTREIKYMYYNHFLCIYHDIRGWEELRL